MVFVGAVDVVVLVFAAVVMVVGACASLLTAVVGSESFVFALMFVFGAAVGALSVIPLACLRDMGSCRVSACACATELFVRLLSRGLHCCAFSCRRHLHSRRHFSVTGLCDSFAFRVCPILCVCVGVMVSRYTIGCSFFSRMSRPGSGLFPCLHVIGGCACIPVGLSQIGCSGSVA